MNTKNTLKNILKESKSIIWSRYCDWLGQMINASSLRILFLTYFRASSNSYRFTNLLKLVIVVKYHILSECCLWTALYTHMYIHTESHQNSSAWFGWLSWSLLAKDKMIAHQKWYLLCSKNVDLRDLFLHTKIGPAFFLHIKPKKIFNLKLSSKKW